MELLKTRAFVVRSSPFQEYDKRVILLTRDFGKLIVFAPSAQKSKKRFSGALEPLTLIELTYQKKRLQDTFILDTFSPLKKDIKKMSYGCYYLEVIETVMHENESQEELFHFLLSFLNALITTKNEELLSRLFEARLLPKIGYLPELRQCLMCKKSLSQLPQVYFSIPSGGIKCLECSDKAGSLKMVSKEVVIYLDQMIFQKKLSQNIALAQEMKTFLPSFLFYQLGKEMNSYYFIEKMWPTSGYEQSTRQLREYEQQ